MSTGDSIPDPGWGPSTREYLASTAVHVDAYVRENRIALEVFDNEGHRLWHGISRRTLSAFARRGLVWFEHDDRGGLTEKGRAVLRQLEAEDTVQ